MIRKTKIICTIGPATAELSALRRLIDEGMDVARLNFSHGDHASHGEAFRNLREAARDRDKPVAVMQDLQGPKLRIGKFRDGKAELREGASFTITSGEVAGDESRVSSGWKDLHRCISPGNTILLDDGYVVLKVMEVTGGDILTRVEKGGLLNNNKGLVVPGVRIDVPVLGEKDLSDLRYGLSLGVDVVALSFVQSERDIIALRNTMKEFRRIVPIVAKIERHEGIADIEDIIRESDAVMVARGDLGVEMKPEEVPVLQKRIIARCNAHGKPVITATQMLESMIAHPRPTRAEASDVANAVLDGSDAVMLSGETSMGNYPFDAVRTMDRIIRVIEEADFRSHPSAEIPAGRGENIADAIGRACCVLAGQIGAAAIVPLTSSGGTARVIAKHRPVTPILALTDREETLRVLSLTWGIVPLMIPPISDSDSTFKAIRPHLLRTGIVKEGDWVVYTAGIPLHLRTSTNMLKVEQI